MKSDTFVFACRENPEVLRSLEWILDGVAERMTIGMINERDHDEICRYQGSVRMLAALKKEIQKAVRLRDAADKSANGRN